MISRVPRQPVLEHRHRPGLECLRHQGVVGVAHHLLALDHRRVPAHAVQVDQDAQQLGHGQRRVGVVQVNRDLVAQAVQAPVVGQVTRHDVLHRGADQEILLLEPQLASGVGRVVRIEHPVDHFGRELRAASSAKVAAGESGEVDRPGRIGLPLAQHRDPLGGVAGHDEVVGIGEQLLCRQPSSAGAVGDHAAPEPDGVANFRALQFPRIAVAQPVVGLLDLLPIVDALREHAVAVAQAITEGRHAQRGQRIQKAGGQAPETTVAERRIGLDLEDVAGLLARRTGSRLELTMQPERRQRIAECAAHEEFHRQVVNPLGLAAAVFPQAAVHALGELRPAGMSSRAHPHIGRCMPRGHARFALDTGWQCVGACRRMGFVGCRGAASPCVMRGSRGHENFLVSRVVRVASAASRRPCSRHADSMPGRRAD